MNKAEAIAVDVMNSDVKLPDQSWEIAHHFSDGLYAKEMNLPAGHVAIAHDHSYSHLSILAKGRATVVADDVETEYTAPACINIEAGVKHAIWAREDIVWFCIHAEEVACPEDSNPENGGGDTCRG